MIKSEKINLAILVLISLLLSVYLFFRTYVISLDGAFQFIPMAKMFAFGSIRDAINFGGQQPLYSFFIFLVSRWVPDFETAGKLVSAFFGIAAVFPVYFLGKRMFDRRIAFFAAFFLGLHPYFRRYSADVLKESTYLFFFVTAIWFSWRTFEGERKYPYPLIPLLSTLAYLVRQDGIEVLLGVLFYLLFLKNVAPPHRRWLPIFFLLLSAAIVFTPCLLHLRETAGEWTLGKTKTLSMMFGWQRMGAEIPYYQKVLYSLKELNLEIIGTFHPLYLFLLVFGLWKKKGLGFKSGEKFLILLGALHYVILFLLIMNLTEWKRDETVVGAYFSGRHVLPLLTVSIFWVGEGGLKVHSWLSKKMAPLFPKGKISLVVSLILIILASGLLLPKTLKPQRYERLPEKWAGIWIKNQHGKGTTVFTSVHRVAYYAEGKLEYVKLEKDTIDKIGSSMIEKKAQYLVIQGRDLRHFTEEALQKNFLLELKRFEGKGMERILIYEKVR